MKKTTAGIFFGILLTAFLLAGCGNGTDTTTTQTFIGGVSDGVDISFLTNSPPAEVVDNGKQPFDIVLQIENIGEYEIPASNFQVELSGIYPQDFSKVSTDFAKTADDDFTKTRKLSSGDIIPGTTQQISFNDLSYTKETKGTTQFNLKADVCYDYGTYAVSNICYKESLFGTTGGACSASEAKTVSNSQAPVQITSIKEQPAAENKISLTIEISHVGTGEVFLKGANCDDTEYSNLNKVDVNIDTGIDGSFFKCTGWDEGAKTGTVNLNDGKAILVCTQAYEAAGDFEKQMNVELQYGYRQTLTKTLTVKHLGE